MMCNFNYTYCVFFLKKFRRKVNLCDSSNHNSYYQSGILSCRNNKSVCLKALTVCHIASSDMEYQHVQIQNTS